MEPTEAAHQLIGLTADWFPRSLDPSAITATELALAGFARCRRLLEGMLALHRFSDVAGALARSLFETWLTALYLLLAGDEAIERVDANDQNHLYRHAKRFLEELDESDSSTASCGRRPS